MLLAMQRVGCLTHPLIYIILQVKSALYLAEE